MNKRYNEILNILSKKQRVDVVELSNLLSVSQVTIRKDLNYLEENGIVKREHGYALLSSTNDIAGRLAYHYDDKLKIAKKASELVSDSETVIIENGSCCALLAKELSDTKNNITIITNSTFIANYCRNSKSSNQIILLGGIYQKDSGVNVGPSINNQIKDFYVNKFFIGIDSYSDKTGFTNSDQLRAQAVKDIASQVNEIIVLTESEKFDKHGIVPMRIEDKVSTVITDNNISKETIDHLKNINIKVKIA